MCALNLITICKNTSFRSIMNQGQKWITPGFIVFIAPQSLVSEKVPIQTTEGNYLLKGVVASKKVGNAIKRNRAKRRLREVIRCNPSNEILAGQCVVLIARSKALVLPFDRLQKDLQWAIRKLTVSHSSPKTDV